MSPRARIFLSCFAGAIATAAVACDLNPQPLPPVTGPDDNGAGGSAGVDASAPHVGGDGGTSADAGSTTTGDAGAGDAGATDAGATDANADASDAEPTDGASDAPSDAPDDAMEAGD